MTSRLTDLRKSSLGDWNLAQVIVDLGLFGASSLWRLRFRKRTEAVILGQVVYVFPVLLRCHLHGKLESLYRNNSLHSFYHYLGHLVFDFFVIVDHLDVFYSRSNILPRRISYFLVDSFVPLSKFLRCWHSGLTTNLPLTETYLFVLNSHERGRLGR